MNTSHSQHLLVSLFENMSSYAQISDGIKDEHFGYIRQKAVENKLKTMDSQDTLSLLEMSREQRGVLRLEFSPQLNHVLFKIIFFMVATSFVFCVSVLAAYLMLKTILCIRNLVQVRIM